MSSRKRREKGWARIAMAVVLGLALVVAGAAVAFAQGGGGTAKPPARRHVAVRHADPRRPAVQRAPAGIHGFDETGFIQDATVSGDNSACPDVSQANRLGRHGRRSTARRSRCRATWVIQMPANTMTWADMVHGGPSLASQGQPVPVVRGPRRRQHRRRQAHGGPDVRLTAVGEHRQRRDHEDRLRDRRHPGRHRRPGASRHRPDQRSERPLRPRPEPGRPLQRRRPEPDLHAATGYPMCVPRTDPASADDPLCPQSTGPSPRAPPATAATSAMPASPRCRAAAS